MELLVRINRSWATGALDARLEIADDATVAHVMDAVATKLLKGDRNFELVCGRTGQVLVPPSSMREADVVDGDELSLRRPGAAAVPPPPPSSLIADVVSGPTIGASYTLGPGDWLVGRAGDCAITVPDRSVAWRHIRVGVSAGGEVNVTPMEPGLRILRNGREEHGPFLLNSDDTIQIGATVFVVRTVAPHDGRRDALGHVEFNRIPYVRPVPTERKLGPVPSPPARAKPNPWQWATIIAPVIFGLVMVIVMGNPRFALFALMTPIMAIANWFSSKRRAAKDFAGSEAEWNQRLDDLEADLIDAIATEKGERLRAGPSVTECGRRARTRQTRLWERSRSDGDFAHVRVGLGSVPSIVRLEWTGSDDSRMDVVRDRFAPYVTCDDVPVIVDCAGDKVIGIYGNPQDTDSMASAVLVQLLSLHSPEELVLTAILGPKPGAYEWLKWVPHLRSAASPLPGPQLALGADAGADLLDRLTTLIADTASDQGSLTGGYLVVLVHEDADADRAMLSAALEACATQDVIVLWVGHSEATLPRQCRTVIRLVSGGGQGLMRTTTVGVPDQAFAPELLSGPDAEDIARALAPLRDVTARGSANALPRVATLDAIVGTADPATVLNTWRTTQASPGLEFPLGLAADGVQMLDLVEDGPHALIAGTSGAGKSELLQTMVTSLASRYSPDRLTFLFIDYKGGAAFAPFEDLPHAVGFVTDLDQAGSLRALTSLRAEIRRREGMLEGTARDVTELRRIDPKSAPPSLVIVVDEFATLVREIPEFVAGVVDVAQRGRSLGVHLVLATQRPTGVVNDNILANTNLRISLRVVDPADSMSILGDRDAADIPAPLKGRALVRTGTSGKAQFQTSWGGAAPAAEQDRTPVRVGSFSLMAPASGGELVTAGVRGATQMDAWVQSIVAAFAAFKRPRPRRPWLDPLADVIDIAKVSRIAGSLQTLAPHHLVAGVLDDPTRQVQEPWVIDLEQTGGLLCFGSGSTGKTTMLRSVAYESARRNAVSAVTFWGIDFASRGLDGLDALPQCPTVVTSDDLDAVTRVVEWLEAILDERRRVLAEMRKATWSQVRAVDPAAGPHHLVLVDSFGGYSAALESFSFGAWTDRLVSVLTEGRQVGIHGIITADRRSSVPVKLISSVEARVVLKLNERDDVNLLDIDPKAIPDDQPPGRGMLRGNVVVQLAVPPGSGDHDTQSSAIADLASTITGPAVSRPPTWPALGTQAPVDGTSHVLLGWDDWGRETRFNFQDGGLLVCGASRSGRTSALHRISTAIEGVERVLLAGLRGPLVDVPHDHTAVGTTACTELIDALVRQYGARSTDDGRLQLLVVADDADVLLDGPVALALESLAKMPGVALVAACDAFSAARAFSGWAALLKRSRRIALLNPDMIGDEEVLGVRLKLRPGVTFQPGRGLLMEASSPRMVQLAPPAR